MRQYIAANQAKMRIQTHKPKNFFRRIAAVEAMLLRAEEESTPLDFIKLSQTISKFNNHQFSEFSQSIMQLKINHQAKEFYLKLSYLDHARNNKVMVDKLQDPFDVNHIITDKHQIAMKLHNKYSKMFADESKIK